MKVTKLTSLIIYDVKAFNLGCVGSGPSAMRLNVSKQHARTATTLHSMMYPILRISSLYTDSVLAFALILPSYASGEEYVLVATALTVRHGLMPN